MLMLHVAPTEVQGSLAYATALKQPITDSITLDSVD